MARVRLPGDPGYDAYSWWNPFDWFGGHDETSAWKSDAENKAIADALFKRDTEGLRDKMPEFKPLDMSRYDEFARKQKDRLRKHEKRIEKEYAKREKDYEDYMENQRKTAEESKEHIDAERAYWKKMRDQVYSDWTSSRDSILDFWGGTRDYQSSLIRDIQNQQMGLARDLREAPSSVAEQARINADKAFSQSVAMAGAMGGGVSSNYGNLGDISNTMLGNVLSDTAGLRSAEYAQRINQQSGILNQAASLSPYAVNIAKTDADLRSGIAGQNYNILTGLGTNNVNVGSALQTRMQSLLADQLAGAKFGSDISENYLGRMGGVTDRFGVLGSQGLSHQLNIARHNLIGGQQAFSNEMSLYNMQQQNRDRMQRELEASTGRGGSTLQTIVAAALAIPTGGASLAFADPQGMFTTAGGGGGGGGGNQNMQYLSGLFQKQAPSNIFKPDTADAWNFSDVGGPNLGSSIRYSGSPNIPIGSTNYSGFNFSSPSAFRGFSNIA